MSFAAANADERLTVDSRGRVQLVRDTSLSVDPSAVDPRICLASLQVARQDDGTLAAAWWSVRPDSSALLLAAVSPDGGRAWLAPIRVDTADVSVVGCARPAPSIAASGGFMHLAYAMRASEGTGIFYAHSMTRGRTYEPPVAIIYGDHLTRTAVAADAGVICVAYEDPNGTDPQIGLAISRDWGHIFGERLRGSTGLGGAAMPQVAVTGRQVAVSWLQRAASADAAVRPTRVVRVGRLP